MSIATEITALQNNLSAANSAITTKGGTASTTGMSGLATAIDTIPTGGSSADYGAVDYVTSVTYTLDKAPIFSNSSLGNSWTVAGIDAWANGIGFGAAGVYVVVLTYHLANGSTYPTDSWYYDSPTTGTPTAMSLSDAGISYTDTTEGGTITMYFAGVPDLSTLQSVDFTANSDVNAMCYDSTKTVYTLADGTTIPHGKVIDAHIGKDFEGNIGDNFLMKEACFDNITISSTSIGTIGDNFLRDCADFDSHLTIPTGVTAIGAYFLAGCERFNSRLDFPSTLTSLGAYFLYDCINFSQIFTLPNLTAIPDYYMNHVGYNPVPVNGLYQLNLPSTVTKIGDYFMSNMAVQGNYSVNLPSNLVEIGEGFFSHNHLFTNRGTGITLPSGVTKIGAGFLYDFPLYSGTIYVSSIPTSVIQAPKTGSEFGTNNDFFFANSTSSGAQYSTGIRLSGTNATAWKEYLPNIADGGTTGKTWRKLR